MAFLPLMVPKGIQFQGVELKLFDFRDWISVSEKPLAKINTRELLQLEAKTNQLASSELKDSAWFRGESQDFDSNGLFSPIVSDFHIDSTVAIQYPAGDSTILWPFFYNLDSLKSRKELIRILHLGDSQIEGDRITGYIRQRFQQLFGGCGPGLLPLAEEIPSRYSVDIKTTAMPQRFVLYGKPELAPHKYYSLLHSDFRLKADSLKVPVQFSYKIRPTAYPKASHFERADFLLRNSSGSVSISELNQNGNSREPLILTKTDSLRKVPMTFDSKKNSISVQIQSGPENDFYGVCLDCKSGVAMDNVPLRGSSGLELLKIKPSFLKEQLKQLNVKLVILQFGINVVPYDSKGYSWYESSLTQVIQTIKKSRPDVQVLVVGVSDMARKQDGQWRSFPNIPMVKEAQRNAAKNTRSAFWDLQKVMGGENSIQAWAGTDPPLAGKDYIHLTPNGAQVVGEFLFQSLIKEYQKARLSSSRYYFP